MTDGSKHMLWHAQQKHSQQNAKLPIRFGLADAQAMLTQPDLPRPNVARPESDASQTSAAQSDKRLSSYSPEPQVFFPQQFDTVVDTFGLCSHKDPVAALKVYISTTLNYRMAAYHSCVRCILWHGVLERCLSAKLVQVSMPFCCLSPQLHLMLSLKRSTSKQRSDPVVGANAQLSLPRSRQAPVVAVASASLNAHPRCNVHCML